MCSVPEFCQRVLSEAVKRCHATFGHSAQALFTQHRSKLSHLESSVRARSVTYGLSLSSRSSLVSMPLNRRANIVLSCMIRVNPTVSPGTATCTHARTSTESIDRNSSRFLFKKKCGNSQKTSSSNKLINIIALANIVLHIIIIAPGPAKCCARSTSPLCHAVI